MAGDSGPTSHELSLPYALLIEPSHKSPLPREVRERWAHQRRKENSVEASQKACSESATPEPMGSARQVPSACAQSETKLLVLPVTVRKAACLAWRACRTFCF